MCYPADVLPGRHGVPTDSETERAPPGGPHHPAWAGAGSMSHELRAAGDARRSQPFRAIRALLTFGPAAGRLPMRLPRTPTFSNEIRGDDHWKVHVGIPR